MAVTNDHEFEDWLEKQKQPALIAIATRAALRVFPLVAAEIDKDIILQKITLLTGRAILTSAVARKWPTADVKKAAAAAYATNATTATTTAAAYAAYAAYATATATAATNATTATTITGNDPFVIDLWHEKGMPEAIEASWNRFQELATSDSSWAFWREWYQSFLDAEPMNWDLQRDIALIPDEDWDKGVEHIANLIQIIRLKARTAVSSPLEYLPETKQFDLIPLIFTNDDKLKFVIMRTESLLDNALHDCGPNGFPPNNSEIHRLRQVIDNYATDASLIATTFVEVRASLLYKVSDGTYPDHIALTLLMNGLFANVEELSDANDEIRVRCERLKILHISGELTQSARDEMEKIPEHLGDLLSQNAKTAMQEHTETILDGNKPDRLSLAIVSNWVSTMVTTQHVFRHFLIDGWIAL